MPLDICLAIQMQQIQFGRAEIQTAAHRGSVSSACLCSMTRGDVLVSPKTSQFFPSREDFVCSTPESPKLAVWP